MNVRETRPAVPEDAPKDDVHAPRHLTPAENFILTLKVLAGMGLVGGALWAANFWLAAK